MGEIIRRTVGSKRETRCDDLQVSQTGEGELTQAHKTKKNHMEKNVCMRGEFNWIWMLVGNHFVYGEQIGISCQEINTMKLKNANARRNTLKVAAVERPFELHSVTDAQSRKDVLLHLLGGCGCQSHQGHITKLLLENRQSLRVRK